MMDGNVHKEGRCRHRCKVPSYKEVATVGVLTYERDIE